MGEWPQGNLSLSVAPAVASEASFKFVIGNAAGGNKVCTCLLRTMGPHGRVRVEEGAKQPDEKSGRKSAG